LIPNVELAAPVPKSWLEAANFSAILSSKPFVRSLIGRIGSGRVADWAVLAPAKAAHDAAVPIKKFRRFILMASSP